MSRAGAVGSTDKSTRMKGTPQSGLFHGSEGSSAGARDSIKALRREPHREDWASEAQGAADNIKMRLQDALGNLRSPQPHYTPTSRGGDANADMASLLRRERAANEERNARALALLRSKDDALEATEARCAAAEEEASQLRAQAQSTARRLEDAQARVEELVESNAAHRRRAAETEAHRQEALNAARETGEERVNTLQTELVEARANVAASHHQVDSLSAALHAADEIMEEMQTALNRRSEEQSASRKEVEVLEGYVATLLGIAASDAGNVAGGGAGAGAARENPGDVSADAKSSATESSKIIQLQAANTALEKALVRANLRLAGVNPSVHSTPDTLLAAVAQGGRNAAPTFPMVANITPSEEFGIDVEIARLAGEVVDATDRAAHLEAVRGVAQRAALHAEAELQGALERESQLREKEAVLVSKLERTERAAAEAASELAGLREESEAVRERLSSALEAAKQKTSVCEAQLTEMQEQCNSLTEELQASNKTVAAAREEAGVAKAAADDAKETAERRVSAALRQSGALKEQILNVQEENDTLKTHIAGLEKEAAVRSAKEASQNAATALVARIGGGGGGGREGSSALAATISPSVEELARQLQDSVATQMEIHQELCAAQQVIKANERTIASMHSSIHRLRAALGNEEEEQGGSTHKVQQQEQEQMTDFAGNNHKPEAALADLQARLTRSLAAQEGQATAFAAVAADAHERETALLEQLGELEKDEMKRLQFDALCVAAVGAMHGALAQVALAEGDRDAAEGLLQAEVDPSALADVAAAIAAKVEEYARWIAGHQQAADKAYGESQGLASAQREVIRALSAQLDGAQASVAVNAAKSSSQIRYSASGERVFHLAGLCSLIAHQLETLRAAASLQYNDEDSSIRSAMESMRSTLHVLHAELLELDPHNDADATTAGPSSLPFSTKISALSKAKRHQQEDQDGEQVIAMAEQLAMLTQRIALLTAANEAAQEEASHARGSVAALADELERTAGASREREAELMEQLADAHKECRQLVNLVERMEQGRREWEGSMASRAAAMKTQLANATDAAANFNSSDSTSHQPSEALIALLDGMEGLLSDAAAMEERLKMLEGQASDAVEYRAVATEERWRGLTAAAAQAQGAATAWAEAREQVAAAEERCSQHGQRAKALAERVRGLEGECSEMRRRLEAARAVHEEQSMRVAELHTAQLAAVEAQARAQHEEFGRRADAAVNSAAEEAALRAKMEVGKGLEDALRALDDIQRECVRLRAERDAAHAEFRKFRGIKSAEVALLEQRLGLDKNDPTSTAAENNAENAENLSPDHDDSRELRVAAAAGEIAAACREDAISAALREAKIERRHRTELQQALEAARSEEKKAAAAAKAAEREVGALRQRLREASVMAENKTRELAGQLAAARSELEASAADAAARAAEVDQLKTQLLVASEAVAASERRQREAVEREMQDAHAALAARSAYIGDVAGRVLRAEHEVELLHNELDDINHCTSD